MYYFAKIRYADGLTDSVAKVYAKSNARTRAGVARALGKAAARHLKTDVIELASPNVYCIEHGGLRDYDLKDIRLAFKFDRKDDDTMHKAAINELVWMGWE